MSSIISEKESKADRKSFTAIDISKTSSTGGTTRNDVIRKLKKNRKQIKLQFMRRFPKIGVPNFKSLSHSSHSKKEKLGPLDILNKSNRIHEFSMYDPNMTTTTNISHVEEGNFYPDHNRIRIVWLFCLCLFLFTILFLIGSVIYLLARSELSLGCFLNPDGLN